VGDAASISCPALGNPEPNITWYKGNDTSSDTMINTNNILNFPEVSSNDDGWYTCSAENYLGNVTVTIQLLVGRLNAFCFQLQLHQLLMNAIMKHMLLVTAFQNVVFLIDIIILLDIAVVGFGRILRNIL